MVDHDEFYVVNTEGVVSWEDRPQRGGPREADPECIEHVMRTSLASFSKGDKKRCGNILDPKLVTVEVSACPLAIHIDVGHIKMFVVKLRHEPMHTAVEPPPIKNEQVKRVGILPCAQVQLVWQKNSQCGRHRWRR